MSVTINASIDGTSYNNITKILTGGKTVNLSGIADGSDLPQSIAEIKTGSWTQESDSGTDYTFAHGCAGAPDIIVIDSDFKTRYTSDSKPSNTTIVGEYFNSYVGKSFATVSTTYTGGSNTSTQFATSPVSTDDGYISVVDDTGVTINAASNRRLGGGLTYTWIAIRLA